VKHASLLEVGTGWELIDAAVEPSRRRRTPPVDLVANVRRIRGRKETTAAYLYGTGPAAAGAQAPAVRLAPFPRESADMAPAGVGSR
jgi:hypothetical protein